MKKFVSMAMVAAMTVSMVPATAFAARGEVSATAKIVGAWEKNKDFAGEVTGANVPELQLKITDTNYKNTSSETYKVDVTINLDNALLNENFNAATNIGVRLDDPSVADDTAEEMDKAVAAAEAALEAAEAALEKATEDYTEAVLGVKISETLMKALETAEAELSKEAEAAVTAKAELASAEGLLAEAQAAETAALQLYNAALVDPEATEEEVADLRAKAAEAGEAVAVAKSTVATVKVDADAAAAKVAEAEKKVEAAIAAIEKAQQSATGRLYEKVEAAEKAVKKAEKDLQAAQDAADAAPAEGFNITNVKIDGEPANARTPMSKDADELTFTVEGKLHKNDVIFVDLVTDMDKHSVGKNATVSVSGDLVEADDLVFVSVLGYGITATTKKLATVAEEEVTTLEKDLKLATTVENFVKGQIIELKLSNGFEFTNATGGSGDGYTLKRIDSDTAQVEITADDKDEIVIAAKQIAIEAASAKSGAVATMKVQAKSNPGFKASASVEVMKVVDYTVQMTVEADEDVPVIYSGVNVANYGITDDSDHMALEVTVEESFPGAWSMRKGFNFELPEGVYVTDLDVIAAENFKQGGKDNIDVKAAWEKAFEDAYREADHKGFEFGKRTFDDVATNLDSKEKASVTFQMELVADPGFVGDVNLKFKGDLVDEQEVTIAKFATPYIVKAEHNDMKIDYRYTEVPTEVVITEAEPGLWDKDEAKFTLKMEHASKDFFAFEDADVKVNESESGMEIASKVNEGDITVSLKDDSDNTAGVITVSNMEMFMSRNIPAGPYDLDAVTSLATAYKAEKLFAPDEPYAAGKHDGHAYQDPADKTNYATIAKEHDCDDCDEEYYVGCVADFSKTVKEGFINVVTAGREQDDASFTTKVVVPVGESYIVAGEQQVTLDVPAYVSAAGYTMLPVRAVATALGINNNNVIWNGESRTVTILYGQRIITMAAGEKAVHVNGSVIPASAAVEIVDGRTFLPMRDLATALGVTDITWDAATKTATLNGNA